MSTIVDALLSLRPNAEWKLDGTSYAGIEWLDSSTTKPTEQEINDEIARLDTVEAAEVQHIDSVKQDAELVDILDRLNSLTPAQWRTMVDGIATLADARTMFYRMGLVLMILAREIR